jgi:hypothetical protein
LRPGAQTGIAGCRASPQQRERNDGLVFRSDLVEEFGFELARDGHLAGGDLIRSCADEAELAVAETLGAVFTCRANRRPEDAAGHGTPRVDVATAGGGVERGASGIVGKVFKTFLVGSRCAKNARLAIAGKVWAVIGEPGAGAELEVCGERWICGAQSGHSLAEARGIEGVDGEGAVAALCATDAAGEEVSGAAGGIGERGVDTLEKLGVARGKGHGGRIAEQPAEQSDCLPASVGVSLAAEVSHG